MALADIKNKLPQLLGILAIVVLLLIVIIPGKDKRTDKANEELLAKLVTLEGFDEVEVNIKDNQIIVNIEVSLAGDYDAQLVGWWGSIFGNAALLQGYKEPYEQVIIVNEVNNQAYTYIGVNLVTVDDYMQNRIDDGTFWDEVLISSTKPSKKEIKAFSGLPNSALEREQTQEAYIPKKDRNLSWMWPLLIIIILACIILGIIYSRQIETTRKKIQEKTKKHTEKVKKSYHKHKEKLSKQAEHVKHKAKKIRKKHNKKK